MENIWERKKNNTILISFRESKPDLFLLSSPLKIRPWIPVATSAPPGKRVAEMINNGQQYPEY